MNKKKKKTKYPISLNGYQCIGQCYHKNTKIIHPLTYEDITRDYNFCPIDLTINSRNDMIDTDKCMNPTKKIEISNNIIVPSFKFSSKYFISIYYNIYNLEELLIWLDNNHREPFTTKKRVFNNGMAVYGNNLNMTDHRIIYFINELMIKRITKIYNHVNHFIYIDGDTINLKHPGVNHFKHNKKNKSIIKSYIIEKFMGTDKIYNFMSYIIKNHKNIFSNNRVSTNLVKKLIEYITKKIIVTLDT